MAETRLAIVTPRFWPLISDETTHLLRLAEAFIALGRQVTVVTAQWSRDWPPHVTVGAVPVIRLRGAPRGGWSTLRWMYTLAGWLRERPPGPLLVAGLRHEAFVSLKIARELNVPIVLQAGEQDVAWHGTATFGSRIAARTKEATTIAAATPALAEQLASAGYSQQALRIIERRPVAGSMRSPTRCLEARASLAAVNADLVTAQNARVALAVGRLDAEHCFGDLVRAWRIVTARRPEARLWIVGDGPEREQLYRQINDLDQRFRVLIPGTFDCLDELLQAADILLVPAPHSVPPLAMLEAQAAGLPVVAADSPAIRKYITAERSGLLYPPGDVQALAASALRLIEDPAATVALGSAARDRWLAEATSMTGEAEQYARLLEG